MKLANETLLNLINIAEDIIKRGRKVLLNLQEFANNIIPKPKNKKIVIALEVILFIYTNHSNENLPKL